MTSFSHPFLCLWCNRLHGRDDGPMPAYIKCDAFPDGVPVSILDNEVDHRQSVEGDNGLQFSPIESLTAEEVGEMVFR